MKTRDEILKAQQDRLAQIQEVFSNANELIKGGRPAQIGEVREHGGKKMKKTAQGWVPVGEGGGKGSEKEPTKKEDTSAADGKKKGSQIGTTSSGKPIYSSYVTGMLKPEVKAAKDSNHAHHSQFSDEEHAEAAKLKADHVKQEINAAVKELKGMDISKQLDLLAKIEDPFKDHDHTKSTSAEDLEADKKAAQQVQIIKNIKAAMKKIPHEKIWRGSGSGRGSKGEGYRVGNMELDLDKVTNPQEMRKFKAVLGGGEAEKAQTPTLAKSYEDEIRDHIIARKNNILKGFL